MALEKELETYEKLLPSLVSDQGKFALIQDSMLVGVYDSYNDALTIGYEKFGMQPFLVKKIMAIEEIQCFTRELVSCHI